MNNMIKILVIISVSLVLFLIIGFSSLTIEASAEQAKKEIINVQIWGGSPGGAHEALSIAIGEIIRKEIPNTVVTSQLIAGISAFLKIEEDEGSGVVHIGFGSGFNAGLQYSGRPPFKKPWDKVRILMGLMPSVTQIVVRADSGIESIPELAGNRHSPGTVGMTGETFFRLILEEYGMSYNDLRIQHLTTADSTQMMIDGHLDSMSVNGSFPRAGFVSLAETIDIKLLALPEEVVGNLVKKYPGVIPFTIPAGSYKGVDKDITTTATPNVIHATAELSDELAYQITKAIYENQEYLGNISADFKYVTPELMVTDLGIPFHPGAIKFYKEKGLM